MFRTSTPHTMPDLFQSFVQHMDGTREKKFHDPKSWHNIFWKYITSRIDESGFECLFDEDNGRPNAPIRVLAGMMIVKEGFGWSDSLLFNECDFNIQVMTALGLTNIGDSVPCEATYYNFRRALYHHQVESGKDLIGEVFRQVSREQAKIFGVSGEFARMDSKLIGSNICKSTRLQLIIGVLQVFYKDIKNQVGLVERLSQEDRLLLEQMLEKKAGQIIYGLDKVERDAMLEQLGYLLIHLQGLFKEGESEKYHLIVRVLSEQYTMDGEQVMLKEVKEIESDSLQSPFDEDAAYRKKGEQTVKGYSMNVTETCNEDGLNLITDVAVEKANIADNKFLEDAVERSQEVVGHIEHLNTDGAYHSEDNQEFAQTNETELLLGGMPGKESKYEYEQKEDGSIAVTDTQTGEIQIAKEYKDGKYRIKENGKHRNRRNNVEATIFQMSYPLRNNKSRYRGLAKHQSWASCRAMWVNVRRIGLYIAEVYPDGSLVEKITAKVEVLTTMAENVEQTIIEQINIFTFGLNFLWRLAATILLIPRSRQMYSWTKWGF